MTFLHCDDRRRQKCIIKTGLLGWICIKSGAVVKTQLFPIDSVRSLHFFFPFFGSFCHISHHTANHVFQRFQTMGPVKLIKWGFPLPHKSVLLQVWIWCECRLMSPAAVMSDSIYSISISDWKPKCNDWLIRSCLSFSWFGRRGQGSHAAVFKVCWQ